MKPKTIIVIILAVLAAIILFQNTQVVEVQIFFWKIAMSRILMVSFFLLVGFLLGYFIPKLKKK